VLVVVLASRRWVRARRGATPRALHGVAGLDELRACGSG
jgi:hypothetical protein